MRPQHLLWAFRASLLALALLAPSLGYAQTSSVHARITQAVDDTRLTTLHGNTHPLARPQYDQGAVADSQPVRRMLLLLQRSPQQDAALMQFVDLLHSKASPAFHQWLTPQQFGQQFGPADADIQVVTDWLSSHGFQVSRVAASKMLIEFSGTAGQVRGAFHTEIHRYMVNGQEHFANATDPQIPTALVPLVAGPVSLNNFKKKRQSRNLGVFRKAMDTGKITTLVPSPQYTFACQQSVEGAGANCNALGPGDFAAIYSVNSLYTQGINGTGQTIAIVGDSEICTASTPSFATCSSDDAKTYRSQFGLPTNNLPQVIVDGPTPGFNGDETEGDLDTQLAGAVARDATIDFVIAADTESTAGIDLAAEYIVDNNLAPVMSESFGACEAFLGTSGNEFYATLWEQGAAQGITIIISAGDSGSAGCDDPDLPSPNVAFEFGAGVNGIGSTPFNVVAGGTDFDVTQANYESTYWSNGTNSTDAFGVKDVSATQYIPETSWNDSCAQSLTGLVTGCNPGNLTDTNVNIVGGGGGQSNCAVLDVTGTVCTGYYPKPSWQTVAKGSGLTAATDIARDLPDISLFSADGLVSNSFYVVCESDVNPGGAACDIQAPYFDFIGVGGTSSAAPAFAGIMALVNQKLNAPQGDADYVLFSLGTNFPGTFNDVIKGNNSVPCLAGSGNCSITNPNSPNYGILETLNNNGNPTGIAAFDAGTGMDLATGLGSINAAKLVANWATAAGTFTPTTTTLCLSLTEVTPANCTPGPITITHGGQVFVDITVKGVVSGTAIPVTSSFTQGEDVAILGSGNTGAVDHFTSNNYVITNSDIYPLTSGVFSGATTSPANTNYTFGLVGGSYNVVGHYAGDGTYGASTSTTPIAVTVNPEASTATQSVVLTNFNSGTCVVSPASSSTILVPTCTGAAITSQPYGSVFALRVDVVGATSGQETATGNVTITGLPAAFGTSFPLNTEGYTEVFSPGNFGATTNQPLVPALPPGNYSFTAQFCGTPPACTGDPSYTNSAMSTALSFTITGAAPTQMQLTASPTSVGSGGAVTLTAFVDTVNPANYSEGSYGNAPTGTISFINTATSAVVGSAPLLATTDANGFSAAQATLNVNPTVTTMYSAQFTGDVPADGYYAASNVSQATVTVQAGLPTLSSISPNTGQTGTSVPVTLTGSNFIGGFSINVPANSGLTVSNNPAPVLVSSSSIMATFVISSGATLGADAVSVTTSGGQSGSQTFTVTEGPPSITNISPATGVAGTSQSVTLTGQNFTGATAVTVTGTAGIPSPTFTVVNATTITATFTVPMGAAAGAQNVAVTAPVGTSNTVTFVVVGAPTLSSIAAASGDESSMVNLTLTGTNFYTPANIGGPGGAALNGITVSNIVVANSTTITANFMILANAPLGAQTITVTTSGVTTSTTPPVTFTVNPPPPTISSFSPAGGYFGSTPTVTITGTNFVASPPNFPMLKVQNGANITFSNVVVVSSTMITATFTIPGPPFTNNSNITVTTAGGTSNPVTFGVGTQFMFTANPTSASVAPGGSASTTFTITDTPTAGAPFPAVMTFAASGLPNLTNCTIASSASGFVANPPSLPASDGTTAPLMGTVTCTTTAPSSTIPGVRGPWGRVLTPTVAISAWSLLMLALTTALLLAGRKRRTRLEWALAAVLVFTFAGFASACGGGGSSTPPPMGGTTPGTYTITVTATSGNATQPITFMLTVT